MKTIYKKKAHLILLAVFSLMIMFFMPQNTQAATVKRPSKVTGLTVKQISKNTAKLTWKKTKNAKRYQVYCSANGGSYRKIKTTKKTTFTHNKLKSGATYVYKVRGINQKKKGSDSSVQRIYTLADTNPAVAASVTGNTATLKWNKVANATGYYVYKAIGNGNWMKLADTKNLYYNINGLELGNSYTYRVIPYRNVNGKIFEGSLTVKTITMPTSGWMLDYVQPYAKTLTYASYNARSFNMRGIPYTHGFVTRATLDADEGIYFNLGGKYSFISFKVGMKDGNYTSRKSAKVTIKADGKVVENGEFEIKDDGAFSTHTINVQGCKDLRLYITQGNIIKKVDTEYGFADIKLSK